MGRIVDTLITEFKLQTKDFKKNVSNAGTMLRKFGGIVKSSFAGIAKFAQSAIIPVTLFAGALIGLAKSAIDAYNQLSAVKASISVLLGDADKAPEIFNKLIDASKAPGATMEGMFEGYQQLFALIRDSDWVIGLLKEITNQLAFTGNASGEGFKRVITNLSQILGAGRLTGDELRETAQILPRFREALKNAFGTSDTEAISDMGTSAVTVLDSVMREFNKFERAPVTSLVTWTKFLDSVKLGLSKIGEVIVKYINPYLVQFTEIIYAIEQSNVLDGLIKSFSPGEIDVSFMARFISKGIGMISAFVSNLNNLKDVFVNVFQLISNALKIYFVPAMELVHRAFILFTTLPGQHRDDLLSSTSKVYEEQYNGAVTGFDSNIKKLEQLSASPWEDGKAIEEDIFNRITKALANPSKTDNGKLPNKPIEDPIQKEIERNTKEIAENTSLTKDFILGGGNLGAKGIAKTALNKLGGRGGQKDRLLLEAVNLIADYVSITSLDNRRVLD